MADSISLNKYLSSTGICSRREADRWIEAGRVSINGTLARKGNRVEPGDTVLLDGRPVGGRPAPIYLAFHKPPGVTSTTDPKDPDNIIDYLKYPQRIFPIGRLDKASTGLILLTNDGDVVNEILRAENAHEKEYIVTVDRPITPAFVRGMAAGVPILGTRTAPCAVERLGQRGLSHHPDPGDESTDTPYVHLFRLLRAYPQADTYHAHRTRRAAGGAVPDDRPTPCTRDPARLMGSHATEPR